MAGVVTHSPAAGAVVAVLGTGAGAYVSVRCWRVSIALTPGTLVVRNLLRTYRLPLTQIVRTSARIDGIEIDTRDGRRIRASAVQRSQLADMAGRQSEADDVAELIRNAATARSGLPVSQPDPPVPTSAGQFAVRICIGAILLLGSLLAGTRLLASILGTAGILLVLIPALAWFQGWRLDRRQPPRR